MAQHQFHTKPLQEAMITYCQLEIQEQISVKLQ